MIFNSNFSFNPLPSTPQSAAYSSRASSAGSYAEDIQLSPSSKVPSLSSWSSRRSSMTSFASSVRNKRSRFSFSSTITESVDEYGSLPHDQSTIKTAPPIMMVTRYDEDCASDAETGGDEVDDDLDDFDMDDVLSSELSQDVKRIRFPSPSCESVTDGTLRGPFSYPLFPTSPTPAARPRNAKRPPLPRLDMSKTRLPAIFQQLDPFTVDLECTPGNPDIQLTAASKHEAAGDFGMLLLLRTLDAGGDDVQTELISAEEVVFCGDMNEEVTPVYMKNPWATHPPMVETCTPNICEGEKSGFEFPTQYSGGRSKGSIPTSPPVSPRSRPARLAQKDIYQTPNQQPFSHNASLAVNELDNQFSPQVSPRLWTRKGSYSSIMRSFSRNSSPVSHGKRNSHGSLFHSRNPSLGVSDAKSHFSPQFSRSRKNSHSSLVPSSFSRRSSLGVSDTNTLRSPSSRRSSDASFFCRGSASYNRWSIGLGSIVDGDIEDEGYPGIAALKKKISWLCSSTPAHSLSDDEDSDEECYHKQLQLITKSARSSISSSPNLRFSTPSGSISLPRPPPPPPPVPLLMPPRRRNRRRTASSECIVLEVLQEMERVGSMMEIEDAGSDGLAFLSDLRIENSNDWRELFWEEKNDWRSTWEFGMD